MTDDDCAEGMNDGVYRPEGMTTEGSLAGPATCCGTTDAALRSRLCVCGRRASDVCRTQTLADDLSGDNQKTCGGSGFDSKRSGVVCVVEIASSGGVKQNRWGWC